MEIRLFATGGTIASLPDPSTGIVRASVTAEELVQGVPGLERLGPITVDELSRVNSSNVTPSGMLEVARRVSEALAQDSVVGAIVTHGTDTVEETAFLCDVTVASEKPVVFTAAMRSGDQLGADGPRNLICAALTARADPARGLGSVLVIDDEVHAARWVRKQNARRPSAFASPDHAPIGQVTPEELSLSVVAPHRVLCPLPAVLDRPVPVIQTYTGLEAGVIETVLGATGAAGLVLEGTGLGNVPGTAEPGIRLALDHGLPVVIATRVPAGGTAAVYGGPGGGATLEELGVLQAHSLTAAKARLLLMLLLQDGRDGVESRFAAAAEALARW
jgi:L-asparaginase